MNETPVRGDSHSILNSTSAAYNLAVKEGATVAGKDSKRLGALLPQPDPSAVAFRAQSFPSPKEDATARYRDLLNEKQLEIAQQDEKRLQDLDKKETIESADFIQETRNVEIPAVTTARLPKESATAQISRKLFDKVLEEGIASGTDVGADAIIVKDENGNILSNVVYLDLKRGICFQYDPVTSHEAQDLRCKMITRQTFTIELKKI